MNKWSSFSTSLSAFGIVIFFYFSHSDSCVLISHCGFIFHFPMVNDDDYLFMCLFPICISSSVKSLFKSFVCFSIGFFFMLSFRGLYVFQIIILCQMCGIQLYFSQLVISASEQGLSQNKNIYFGKAKFIGISFYGLSFCSHV